MFFGGLNQALDEAAQRKLAQQQAAAQQQQTAGQSDLGGALGGFSPQVPGAQPMNPVQGLLQKLGGALGMGGQQQGGPQPSAGPGAFNGQGQLDLKQLVDTIKARKPGISPGELFAAIGQAMPLLNMQARQQYQQMTLALRQKAIEQQGNLGQERVDVSRQNADTRERQGQQRIDQKTSEFNEREGRLRQQFGERGQMLREKAAKAQTLQEKAQAIRELESLQREVSTARSQAIRASSILDADEKKKALDDARADADKATKAIDDLKLQMRNQATGGASPNLSFDQSKGSDAGAALARQAPQPGAGQTGGMPAPAPPANGAKLIQQAKEAIAQGAPRDQVLKVLQQKGISPAALGQ